MPWKLKRNIKETSAKSTSRGFVTIRSSCRFGVPYRCQQRRANFFLCLTFEDVTSRCAFMIGYI